MSARAAFFDLDRTLLRVNSGKMYVRWRVRQGDLRLLDVARMSWWTLQYTFGILDAVRVSREAVKTVRGLAEDPYREACAAWVRAEVLRHVSATGREELARRREEGYLCALLTTSSPYIAGPVAESEGVEHVLCSGMRVEAGRFTGELEDPLCYGDGKVERARRWAETHDVDLARSVFFTDSVSDLPMLEAVGEPRVINPDPRLRREAQRRGWPIEIW